MHERSFQTKLNILELIAQTKILFRHDFQEYQPNLNIDQILKDKMSNGTNSHLKPQYLSQLCHLPQITIPDLMESS